MSSFISAQELEVDIFECINNNFEQVNIDFGAMLDEIESDLLESQIITNDYNSILSQIEYVAKNGFIEKPRKLENIKFESLGLKTIKFCIDLNTYANDSISPPPFFRLTEELEYLSQNISFPYDLQQLRKDIAALLIKYNFIDPHSILWRNILVSYLYLFSETEEFSDFVKLPPFDDLIIDSSKIVTVHTNANDITYANHQEINLSQLCNTIQPYIEQGYCISLTNDNNTKYLSYLQVYNSIKECVIELRNDRAMKIYEKTYSEITPKNRTTIDEELPLCIVEKGPKKK